MDYILMGIAAAVIIALLMYIQKTFDYSKWNNKKRIEKTETLKNPNNNNDEASSTEKKFMNCPLCSAELVKGENIFSKVYRPMTVPDQRCTISGCPHCFPKVQNGLKRICPVCKKTVPVNGYLVARLFNKTTGKKHVMIIGCTECLKGYSKNS